VVRAVVNHHVYTDGGNRVSVEVVLTSMKTFIGRDGRIERPGVKNIICCIDLGESFIPALERKARVDSMEAGYEMVLP